MKDETRTVIELMEILGLDAEIAKTTARAIDLAQKQYDAMAECVAKCYEMAVAELGILGAQDYVETAIEALCENRNQIVKKAMMKHTQRGTQG